MAAKTLNGKTAIVTGSGKLNGIGAATAIALAKQGASVSNSNPPIFSRISDMEQIFIHYNTSTAKAAEVVAHITSLGVKCASCQADASSPEFGKILVSAALSAFETDTIDFIVNNAAAAMAHFDLSDILPDDFDTIFRCIVRAPFLLIQAALPYLKSDARIVNVSSIIARLGSQYVLIYGASKGALNALTPALADHLGEKGITINTVAPGPIDTDLSAKEYPMGRMLEMRQSIKREATAREAADVIAFFCSPAASFVTGQLVHCDGGINFG